MGGDFTPKGDEARTKTRAMPTLFRDDFHYLQAAISHLQPCLDLQFDPEPSTQRIDLVAPEELKQRFRFLPREVWPVDGLFALSADQKVIQAEIKRSRKDEEAWPQIHYLWELNPVVEWVNDKVLAAFGRHEAPVITLHGALEPDETAFILSGLVPNRKGHPLVHHWFGVVFRAGVFQGIEGFQDVVKRTDLGARTFPNRRDGGR
jgi:hypothetical protein